MATTWECQKCHKYAVFGDYTLCATCIEESIEQNKRDELAALQAENAELKDELAGLVNAWQLENETLQSENERLKENQNNLIDDIERLQDECERLRKLLSFAVRNEKKFTGLDFDGVKDGWILRVKEILAGEE